MSSRLAAKRYKSGRRKGQVRVPGRPLPFTLEEFRAWALEKIGMGATPCYYCPRLIDVLSFQPDHRDPLEHGGGIGLDNLVPSCEDCNRLKGAMPPDDFIWLMQILDKLSTVGRADVKKRLRAGAMGLRLRFHGSSTNTN